MTCFLNCRYWGGDVVEGIAQERTGLEVHVRNQKSFNSVGIIRIMAGEWGLIVNTEFYLSRNPKKNGLVLIVHWFGVGE